MKVQNVSDGIRVIADTGDVVEPDGHTTVPKELGESLCQQGDVWREVKKSKSSKGDD